LPLTDEDIQKLTFSSIAYTSVLSSHIVKCLVGYIIKLIYTQLLGNDTSWWTNKYDCTFNDSCQGNKTGIKVSKMMLTNI